MATYAEMSDYVWQADESESECKAEFGMGAVSMGYDGGQAMMHYDGFRAADDPTYAEYRRILHDRYGVVRVVKFVPFDPDDIPF